MSGSLAMMIKNAPITPYRLLFSIVACFAFIFCFDLVWHVGLLGSYYAALPALKDAALAATDRNQWYPLFQLSHAIAIAIFYACWRYRSGDSVSRTSYGSRYSDAAGFGGFIGLFTGMALASMYIYLPIPGTLALLWATGELLKGLGLGLVLAAVYPKPIVSAA